MPTIRWELKRLNPLELFAFKPVFDSWFDGDLGFDYMHAQRRYPMPDKELEPVLEAAYWRLWTVYQVQRARGMHLWKSDSFGPKYLSWMIANCQPLGGVWENPKPSSYKLTGTHCRHWSCPWCHLRLHHAYVQALQTSDAVEFPEQGLRSGWNLGKRVNATVFEQEASWLNLDEAIGLFFSSTQADIKKTWIEKDGETIGLPGAEFTKGVRLFSVIYSKREGVKDVLQPCKLTLRMTFLHTAGSGRLAAAVPARGLKRYTNLSADEAIMLGQPYSMELRHLTPTQFGQACDMLKRRRKMGVVNLTQRDPKLPL